MIRALKGAGAAVWLALALTILSASPSLAQAATDTTVTVPWGDTLASVLVLARDTLTALLLAGLAAATATLPGWIKGIMATAKVDQIIAKAIDYAINSTAGAVKGQELSFDVGNKVVKQAVDYVVKHGPGWLISWMGGENMIKEKIIARLDVAKDVALK